jgi:hypothetical protein
MNVINSHHIHVSSVTYISSLRYGGDCHCDFPGCFIRLIAIDHRFCALLISNCKLIGCKVQLIEYHLSRMHHHFMSTQ